jgi:hypothetical protein
MCLGFEVEKVEVEVEVEVERPNRALELSATIQVSPA